MARARARARVRIKAGVRARVSATIGDEEQKGEGEQSVDHLAVVEHLGRVRAGLGPGLGRDRRSRTGSTSRCAGSRAADGRSVSRAILSAAIVSI